MSSSPVLVEPHDDDVKVYLRDGRVLESETYGLIDDFTTNVNGLVIHLGQSIKINGEIFPITFVKKITARVVKVEEQVVYNGNSSAPPPKIDNGRLKKTMPPADINTNTVTRSADEDEWKAP